MGLGILDLIQQTEYDYILNFNPEITFFKVIYYRYTNFSRENIIEYFDDDPHWGNEIVCTLSKTGDLISSMFVEIQLDITEVKNQSSNLHERFYKDLKETLLSEPYQSLIEAYLLQLKVLDPILNYKVLVDTLGLAQKITEVINYIDDILSENDITTNNQPLYNFNILSITNNNRLQSTNLISLNHVLDNFETFDIFKLFILLDYISVLQSINDYYSNGIFEKNNIRQLVKLLNNHEYNKLSKNVEIYWIHLFAHFLISEVYLDIGGTKIDRYDCHFYNITTQLSKIMNSASYQRMIEPKESNVFSVFIPLIFWFNKYNSCALPCVSLKYQDVKIGLKLNTPEYLTNLSEFIKISGISLYVDYIYLTNTEKTKFTTSDIEYLIIQNQKIKETVDSTSLNIELDFFNPCKEIYWICWINDNNNVSTEYFIPGTSKCPIIDSQFFFNNVRFGTINKNDYWSTIQPYETHTRTPNNGISVFSFALFPEEYQPSGSLNIGYIPSKYLQLTFDPILEGVQKEVYVYATNYNILRISKGFARLLYE